MEDSKTTVLSYLSAFRDHSYPPIDKLLDEAVIWHIPGGPKVASAGIGQGKRYVKQWLHRFWDNFITQEFQVQSLIANGEDVYLFGHFTHQVVRTGRYFSGDFVVHFQVKHGKITHYQIHEDTSLIDRAFDPDFSDHQNTAKLNGTSYSFTDAGQGKPVLFAHGLFTDRSLFEAQVASLAKTRRCLNFDLPAHGATDFLQTGWSLDQIADDVALFIKEQRLQNVTFVGQSQGGMVGLRLAARYPQLIENLILIGTTCGAEADHKRPQWMGLQDSLKTGNDLEKAALFERVLQPTKTPDWIRDNPQKCLQQINALMDLSAEGLCRAIDAAVLNRQDCTALLAKIEARALILAGSEDTLFPLSHSQKMHSLITGSDLQIIDGAAHHAPLEKPLEVTKVIEEFLHWN